MIRPLEGCLILDHCVVRTGKALLDFENLTSNSEQNERSNSETV